MQVVLSPWAGSHIATAPTSMHGYFYDIASALHTQTLEDLFPQSLDSVDEYNHPGGLATLSETISSNILHEMTSSEDIIQFLLSSRSLSQARKSPFLRWSQSPAAAQRYTFQTVPLDKIDPVLLTQSFSSPTKNFFHLFFSLGCLSRLSPQRSRI